MKIKLLIKFKTETLGQDSPWNEIIYFIVNYIARAADVAIDSDIIRIKIGMLQWFNLYIISKDSYF